MFLASSSATSVGTEDVKPALHAPTAPDAGRVPFWPGSNFANVPCLRGNSEDEAGFDEAPQGGQRSGPASSACSVIWLQGISAIGPSSTIAWRCELLRALRPRPTATQGDAIDGLQWVSAEHWWGREAQDKQK